MSSKTAEYQEFLTFAEKLADTSRQMLNALVNKKPTISIKSDASYVTTADKDIEKKLREMITAAYPDHGILGEEFENHNIDAKFVWVLDPIDGTAPFIAGIPVYGTLIGLAKNRKPFIGVIDHPATSDRWTGVAGLFAKHNGQPAKIRSCASLSTAYVTCSNPDFLTVDEHERFSRLRDKAQYVQYGASCFAYGILASGRSDIAIDSGLEAFDVYASAAIIEGAGGVVCDWEGNDISLEMKGSVLAIGDKTRRDELINLLKIKKKYAK